MFLTGFYRAYISICAGIAFWLWIVRSVWLSIAVAIAARAGWFGVEEIIKRMRINRDFKRHMYEFKQQLGPYGIRLVNRAEQDWHVKKSLAEVFSENPARLKKNVEQLKVMDALFQAGMRPDADSFQLHDCKLKYGAYRLERLQKTRPS